MGKWVWVVTGLLTINLIILDVWVLGDFSKKRLVLGDRVEKVVEPSAVNSKPLSCDKDCLIKIIDEKLKELVSKYDLKTKENHKTAIKTVNKPLIKPTNEKFIRISDGYGQGVGWIRLNSTGFWLDTALHGELVKASWQGWLESSGGGLDGWVRLYDATNSRVVDGSTVRVIGLGKNSFYSSNLSIWRGQNQYYIEIKDAGGGNKLTVSEPRLKLVVR